MGSRALVADYYGQQVVSVEWDAIAQLWVLGSTVLSGLGSMHSVAISKDGRKAIVVDGNVIYPLVWNGVVWVAGTHVHVALSCRNVAMSRDGQHALVTCSAGNRIEVLEWNSGTNEWDLKSPIVLTQAAFVAIADDNVHALATSNTLNTALPLAWNGAAWIADAPVAIAPAGGSGYGIDFTSDNQRAVVVAPAAGTITPLTWNGLTWVAGAAISLTSFGNDLRCVALNSLGTEGLVTCSGGGKVFVISWNGVTWSKTGTINAPYPIQPTGVIIGPTDDHALVSGFGVDYCLRLERISGTWIRNANLVVGDAPEGMDLFVGIDMVQRATEPSYWNAHRTIIAEQGDTIAIPQWVRRIVTISPATVALNNDVGATVTDQLSGEWLRPARLTSCSVGAAGTVVLKY